MTKKVLILGGGQMGSVIAEDLSKTYETKIADINQNVCDIKFDISKANKIKIKDLFDDFDLIIGALPSFLGIKPIIVAAENGNNYVDLSFSNHNPKNLHGLAEKNNSIIFHDCGLSPGLSNLLAGRFNLLFCPKQINIMVGGISKDENAPYGHINTWCPGDLKEEYIRPARFIDLGKEVSVDPLSEESWLTCNFDEVGTLECFLSDGLRTLLDMKGPNTIKEYTLRRKGHLKQVKRLIEDNKFIEEITHKCSQGDDLVLLKVDCDQMYAFMKDEAKNGMSSMSRTTAYSCSAFAKLILEDKWMQPGIFAPEDIGASHKYSECFDYILDCLSDKGIKIKFIINQ